MNEEIVNAKTANGEAPPAEDLGLTIFLIVLIGSLFVIFPLLPSSAWERELTSVSFSLILISGVFLVAQRRTLRILVLVVAAVSLTTEWLAHVFFHDGFAGARHLASILFLSVTAYCLLLQVLRSGRVNSHRVRGAIAIYMLLGLIWAQAYALVDLTVADSFTPPVTGIAELVYFSYVTLTTLGYGDIQPVSGPARSLTIAEALVGQFFIGVLIARLVSLEIAHSMRKGG